MTKGVIWKQLLEFSIPMAIGLLFQQLYNTVDAVVVGQYVGKEALAAVGSTGNIINMMVGLCAGLATGAGVVISQFYGAHDHKKLRTSVNTTIAMTLIMCVIATIVGIAIVRPMLRLMATPEDVMPQAEEYLFIYFAGVSGLMVYNMGSGILRAVGDSRHPLYILCFSALTNIVFDLLFVLKFNMGVAGVAYATILSQFMSAILVLYSLTRTDAPYGIIWKKLGLNRDMLKRIFAIGMPSGIQQGITSFSNVFVQAYINFFQSDCMAGWSSYNKLDAFILIPVQSIALAATTFVGQNHGAGNIKRSRSGVRQAIAMSLVVTMLTSAFVLIFQRQLLMLFTREEGVIEYGRRFITIVSPFYVTLCFNQVISGAMRGMGNARSPMIIMLISFVAIRQILLYGNKLLGNSFFVVALAYPTGWIICSLLMIILYKRSLKATDYIKS